MRFGLSVGAAALTLVTAGGSAAALVNCNDPTVYSSDQTVADDFVKTEQESTACIIVHGAGTVINMAGHTITCDSPTGLCGPAINCSSTCVVRNGNIVEGSGEWNVGVQCFQFFGGGYQDCEVSNMYIEATGVGVAGGYKVDTSVIKGPDHCVSSSKTLTSGGYYRENYCSATDAGFLVTGPASGAFTLERNFVRAGGGTGVEVQDGNLTLDRNIVEAATPIDDTSGDTIVLDRNICSNLADCPEPTERGFSLTFDFD
jgi:hypothetical protein